MLDGIKNYEYVAYLGSSDPSYKTINAPLPIAGYSYEFTLYVYDKAGNRSVGSKFTIYYDNSEPEINNFDVRGQDSSESGYTNTNKNLVVSIDSVPSVAYLKEYYIMEDGVKLELENKNGKIYIKSFLGNKEKHNLKLFIVNQAGKVVSDTIEVIVDMAKPDRSNCTISFANEKEWSNKDIELTLNNCSDTVKMDYTRIDYKKNGENTWTKVKGDKLYIKAPENSMINTS